MLEPNPYSPDATDSVVDEVTVIDKRRRVLIAVAIGLGCCLIGPIFLWLYLNGAPS